MDKKPFKETKLGSWIANKAPHVLDTVGDLMPDKGILGVVKKAIEKLDLSPVDHADFSRMHTEQLKELLALEAADRSSARLREVELAKTGHHDFLMYLTGIAILGAFAFVGYANVYLKIEGSAFIRFETMVETLTVGMASYYFGYSKGQSDKSKLG
jgi:hypothetical protein